MSLLSFLGIQQVPGSTIRIKVKDPNELLLVKEGKTLVNLWTKPGMNHIDVYISTQSFVNGTGKIGEVPRQYFKYFKELIEENGKVRGIITKVSDQSCEVEIQ